MALVIIDSLIPRFPNPLFTRLSGRPSQFKSLAAECAITHSLHNRLLSF